MSKNDFSTWTRKDVIEHRDELFARMKAESATATEADWGKLEGEYDACKAELDKRDRQMRIAAEEDSYSHGRRIEADPIRVSQNPGRHDDWFADRRSAPRSHEHRGGTDDPACLHRWAWDSFGSGYGSGVTCLHDGGEIRGLMPNESVFRAVTGRDAPPARESFSLGRMLEGMLTGKFSRDLEKRVHSGLVSTLGGVTLMGNVAANILDLARARSTYASLCQTIPMPGRTLWLAQQTSDLTPTWRVETGSVANTDSAFGAIKLEAKSVAFTTRISNELIKDAPNLASFLESAGIQAMANAIDRGAYLGAGGAEPTGIFTDPRITQTTDNSAGALTLDQMMTDVKTLWDQNFEPNAFVSSNAVARQHAVLKDGTGRYLFGGDAPGPIQQMRRLHTSQLTSQAAMGDFSLAVLGVRDEIEVEVFRAGADSTGADALATNSTILRFTWRGDCAVLRDNAFALRTNILTT